jgi:translation elongation factor EF-Tu-like GTPase
VNVDKNSKRRIQGKGFVLGGKLSKGKIKKRKKGSIRGLNSTRMDR